MQSDFTARTARVVGCGALLSVILALPMTASAQTPITTGNLTVQITIQEECTLGTIAGINFGTKGLLAQNVDENGTIQVTCTKGTDYKLDLNKGSGVGATEANRLMTKSGSADTISYSLYQDSGRSQFWGSSTDALSGIGTGAIETVDVFARVPVQDTPEAGLYEDVVTVTLSY